MDICPGDDNYVVAFRLRADNYKPNTASMNFPGYDASGLNAVVLKCKNGEKISSSQEKGGKWTNWSNECAQGFTSAVVNQVAFRGEVCIDVFLNY